ncbi:MULTISPECIES: hypothetical protein [unclassified Corynebacterium]|uniref:hypothetical protein n=1 Tax=unclassified Corynebacterium TaxID=2624378 RepID=UPI002A909DD7|nr:hypothetical protein [Corynebacterium sp.]MDY5785122.1 hypothetical protein [Corynebacterium sp.]
MSSRSAQAAAAVLALVLALAACVSEDSDATGQAATDIEVSTPTPVPEEEFAVNDVSDMQTSEITGQKVKDPGMDVSYVWQGTTPAPNGGTVVVVAVTNDSDVPMPADALGQPSLRYTSGGNNRQTAAPLGGEQAGVTQVGLDLPLGVGATVNLKYPFDVSTSNLWDAQFTIGNVTFEGNLNN